MRIRTAMIVTGLFSLALGAERLLPQQPKPSPEPPRFPEAPASARIWKSLTTGKEYRVWTAGGRLLAEWVNISPESRQHGAYIRTECQRAGTRWIGISRSYLPCEREGNTKQDYNWCPWVTKVEIDRMEDNRITGRAEGLKRHDCNGCKILETVWKDFEWVPREPPPVPEKSR